VSSSAPAPRHFLRLTDLSREELLDLLELALALKAGTVGQDEPLARATLP
jgi:ornithine carbamoyltransferase